LAGCLGLVAEHGARPHGTYRTATRSFLSMWSRLRWLVGALRGGSSIIRGLPSIVTAAWSALLRELAEKGTRTVRGREVWHAVESLLAGLLAREGVEHTLFIRPSEDRTSQTVVAYQHMSLIMSKQIPPSRRRCVARVCDMCLLSCDKPASLALSCGVLFIFASES
jgi:hypothetical protein